MTSSLNGKILTIIGANGYVGSAVARQALLLGAKVNSINRSGAPGKYAPWISQVNWVKGDALNPKPYEDVLRQSDAVIHTVGTLIDTSITKRRRPGEAGTYEHLNRDTAKAIGEKLNEITGKKMIYISASKAPPLIPRYLSTKLEAEEYLFHLQNLKVTALRPGFIYSSADRGWSVPLRFGVDAYATIFGAVNSLVPNNSFVKDILKNVDVDASIDLESVVISAIVAAFDSRYDGKILFNQDMQTVKREFYRDGIKTNKTEVKN